MAQKGLGILTGAGFSKYYGLPLAFEFPQYARRYYESKDWRGYPFVYGRESLRPLFEYPEELSREAGHVVDNIEEILRLAPEGFRRNQMLRGIFSVLQAAQHEIEHMKDEHERHNAYLSFLDLVLRGGDQPFAAPIVTVNYDGVPEIVAYNASMDGLDDPDDWDFHYIIRPEAHSIISRCGPWPQTIRKFLIYKLHGSISWDRCPKHGLQQITDARRYNTDGRCKVSGCDEATVPYLVYPEQNKRIEGELVDVWKGAFQALEEVEVVIVIGLAFNPTDTDLLDRTKKLVTPNRKVVVVDPNAKSIAAQSLPGSVPVLVGGSGCKMEDIFGSGNPAARAAFEAATGWPVNTMDFFKPGGTGKPRTITFPIR